AGPVGEADVQGESRATRGVRLDAIHRLARRGRESIEVAEHPHGHALASQLGRLLGDVLLEEGHQRIDLGLRTLPVLVREREQRQHLDAGVERALDGLAHRPGPRLVAGGTGEAALAGPAAVAIHDDGDVPRDRAVQAQRLETGRWRRAHTSRTSASFAFRRSSTWCTASSVAFWTSF